MAVRNIIAAATLALATTVGSTAFAATPAQEAVIDAIEVRIDSAIEDRMDLRAIIFDRSLPPSERAAAYQQYRVIGARLSQLKRFKSRISRFNDRRLALVIDFFDLPVSYS